MSPSAFVVILTTVPAESEAADALARALVEERLAACVNVLPVMTSIYRWQGAVEQSTEQQLVIKTTSARLPALREAITRLHPYEVPELLIVSVDEGAPGYLSWIVDSVGG